ncbi:MAG: RMD1 family protein [Pseudomonadota bacterium]
MFHAYHLADRLKLTAVLKLFSEKPFRASGTEVAYRFGKNQYLIIYNFGSIVLFDVDPVKEQQALAILEQFAGSRTEILPHEEFSLAEGKSSSVDFHRVVVDEITYEKVQIVALVLAQSTALDSYETLVDAVLDKSGAFTELLEREGRIGRKVTELKKFIGFCLNTKQKVISSTYLLDTPDPTWDNPALETLHKQMTDMFEIRDRFRTLEYKLRTIQDMLEILSDLAQSQRTLYLEIAIVALITFEIVMSLYLNFLR